MNIIKAGYEQYIPGNESYDGVLKHIERCGRVCYKSESKIRAISAERFVSAIINRGHTSVLEHGNLIFNCNLEAYNLWYLIATQMRREDTPCHLRFTPRNAPFNTDKNLISGNVRAWRDTISYAKRNPDYRFPMQITVLFRTFGILFEDLLDENSSCIATRKCWDNCMCQMHSEELTPEERYIHCTLTFKFTVDRGISHEMVRHRKLSPSQESTRYCNYSSDQFGGNITVIEPCYLKPGTPPYRIWEKSCKFSETAYFDLLDCGCTPQEARGVLPTALKTEVVLTATFKEWHHFLLLRTPHGVHPQMWEVALPLLAEMQEKYPEYYNDIPSRN